MRRLFYLRVGGAVSVEDAIAALMMDETGGREGVCCRKRQGYNGRFQHDGHGVRPH